MQTQEKAKIPKELRHLSRAQASVADLSSGMMNPKLQSQVRSTANMVTANRFQ